MEKAKSAASDASVSGSDVTGRRQMVSNVLASWVGQLIFIAAGFIMPRLIDHQLGQELLGVWDFAWSVVSCFAMVQVGIVSSISRYVALHRASEDQSGVNRAVSSVGCMLVAMTAAILLLTAGTAIMLRHLKGAELGPYIADAQWIVVLLGLEIAVQTLFSVFGGVITGCHRWGVHNAVTSFTYLLTVIGMMGALFLGGGLRVLALVHLSCEVAACAARYVIAYRVCAGLSIRPSHATRKTAFEMFKFGSKAWLPSVAELVLVQTTNILIAASMGPAPLAVFSRSRNLVKYARDLVVRMAAVLVASVSSLQAAGEDEKIRDLIIKATRYAAFLTLPVTVLLAILGEPLLHVWMGARYADGPLLAVLAVGYFGSTLQLPVMAILSGMNRHGRLAAANMIGSAIATAAVAVVLLWMNLGLTSSAIAATLPLAVINLVYAPLHIRHRTGLSLTKYFREAFWFPLICMVPFALCLAIARWVFPANPMLAFAGGGVAGGLILVPIYWRYVIPGSLKAALIRKLTPASKALPPAVTSPPTGAG